MGQARHISEARMSALAVYIAEHIREDIFSYPFEYQPSAFPDDYAEQQNRWLSHLTQATGLERAVITDSIGQVYAGSQNLISKGEDIVPYLMDTALFKRAASGNSPQFTRLSEIDGVYFQSLYYPFTLRDRLHLIVLESDQNFIAYVDQFRNYLIFASLFLIGLFTLLTAGIFALDRKFQAALEASRRHENLVFLGRISAELAHELKNPLAIIKASVDVLRKKFDSNQEHPAFRYLSEETMRLSRLIGNILGLSKDQALESKPFQPRGALLELRETHRKEFPEVEWHLEIPSHLILIGDRDSFRQIADNLARNASHAMGGKGTFHVTYRPDGRDRKGPKGGTLLFTDSGPGLSPEIRKRMFEPFVSGSKTGTGLGLSIVKNLCLRSGWFISLESNAADKGPRTCFSLWVPDSRES
jgi:signal transduction histidine kinase